MRLLLTITVSHGCVIPLIMRYGYKKSTSFWVGIAASLSSLSITKINIIFEFHVINHKKIVQRRRQAVVMYFAIAWTAYSCPETSERSSTLQTPKVWRIVMLQTFVRNKRGSLTVVFCSEAGNLTTKSNVPN